MNQADKVFQRWWTEQLDRSCHGTGSSSDARHYLLNMKIVAGFVYLQRFNFPTPMMVNVDEDMFYHHDWRGALWALRQNQEFYVWLKHKWEDAPE